MKIRVVSKTELVRRTEYYECVDSDIELDVPESLGPNPSHEDIIKALQSDIEDLSFELSNDDDDLEDVSYEIEVVEDEDEDEDE